MSLRHPGLVPDFVLLHWMFVADSAVPMGYRDGVPALVPHFLRAAIREDQRNASITNASAAVYHSAQMQAIEHEFFCAKIQLVLATELKPRRFRTTWQRRVYDGPTARLDAKNEERTKWLDLR